MPLLHLSRLYALAMRLPYLAVLCCSVSFGAFAEKKPNIVIFLADDLGYAGVNVNGADQSYVRTPNINDLAKQGMNFTQAFATASVCSPTRYALLTGEYSWRTRLKKKVLGITSPLLIDTKTETVASWLRSRGYATAAIGKWHLGYREKRFSDFLGTLSPGPNDVGFDYHFGIPTNLDDRSKVYIENDHIYGLRTDRKTRYGRSFYGVQYSGYDAPQRSAAEVMDTTTKKAIDWISKQQQPFFLYFSAVAVHHPIVPSERMRGTSGVGAYGDFIQDIDYAVGQLKQALKYRGMLDNTVFIFTSDNGGEISKKDWPDRVAYDAGFHFNGPFRGNKHDIFDGGLRVPFIVSWPDNIRAVSTSDAMISTIDIFPTIADLLGDALQDNPSIAPDAVSFAPELKGLRRTEKRDLLVNRDAHGRKSIRFGSWKYVDNQFPKDNEGTKTIGEAKLFNLQKDPREQHNVKVKFADISDYGLDLLRQVETMKSSKSLAVRSYANIKAESE